MVLYVKGVLWELTRVRPDDSHGGYGPEDLEGHRESPDSLGVGKDHAEVSATYLSNGIDVFMRQGVYLHPICECGAGACSSNHCVDTRSTLAHIDCHFCSIDWDHRRQEPVTDTLQQC